MYASFRLPLVLRFAILFAATSLFSLAITAESWADPPQRQADRGATQPAAPLDIEPGDIASSGGAELGVMVVDSPGVGVLVKSVIAGSPAERMGVAPGDFIMAIDGNGITEPTDLATTIQAKSVGSTIAIDVWRDGQQVTKQVLLAASSAVQVVGRAWLGVSLSSFDQEGARIAIVAPGSPAARAKLRSGDIVKSIDDTAIGDVNDLVNAISSHKPGDMVLVTITRDGNEMSYKVKLDAVDDTPAFSFRVPFGDADSDAFSIPGTPMIPVPLDTAPDVWSPWREDFQSLKREMERIREQLRRATGEETELPSQPSSDDPEVAPIDDDGEA